MTASEYFKAGQLEEAIAAQILDVRAHPSDDGKRMFLVELLLFAGERERAAKQLDVIRPDLPEIAAAVTPYRLLLTAVEHRQRLFTGQSPGFLAEPPTHVRLRLEALRTLPSDPIRARECLAQADEYTPTLTGILNGQPFVGLRDADDLFASVFEVISQDNYLWIPMEQVASLAMNPPRYPRDILFFPARLTLVDGSSGEVFLPVLYPGSETATDPAIRLGRLTIWDGSPGIIRGQGQRIYHCGDDDRPLLEWRELELLNVSPGPAMAKTIAG